MNQKVKNADSRARAPLQLKERAIVNAARKRFAHYGFSKVTMEEVADDVGVVKGALYYYFPTKEELFRAVVREEQKRFAERIRNLLGGSLSSSEVIREYVRSRQQYFRDLVNLGRLDYDSWRTVKAPFQKLFHNFELQELKFLQTIFRKGIRSGEFTIAHPDPMAALFLHLLQGLRLRAFRDAHGPRFNGKPSSGLDHDVTLFVQLFLKSLENGDARGS
jgi:TetR/AcrR family transcriptional regulator